MLSEKVLTTETYNLAKLQNRRPGNTLAYGAMEEEEGKK
jgi:hypothetical protein